MAEKLEKINAIGRVDKREIVDELKESYIDYAMSVIVARALPDVRDGLKPVHRRILFAMQQLGLTSSARFRKSALVVGDVLGQGNFGSIDGDPPAAMRYTEAKLAPIAGELLRDLEKETVDFVPNYDATRIEPTVLPSAVPTLLLNGTLGIAVGVATAIPPHNLREVMQALVHLADHADATNEDLLEFVQGPDYPTGGIIFNKKDIAHPYPTGRGGVLARGEDEIVELKSGQSQIIITSIPYKVNKAELIIKIADLVHDKKVEGVKDIRDESTTLADTRIAIDLKSGAYPQKVLNAIYKHTDLETTFHYNMLALVDGMWSQGQ